MGKLRNPEKIWFPGLLNKLVAYCFFMTAFLILFYISAGNHEFTDRTVKGIIELILFFSISSFFISIFAILGRIMRNRYLTHIKRKSFILLIVTLGGSFVVSLFFSLIIVLQNGYGY